MGFVGVSDGWQELQAHKRLNQTYMRAENGNVAVTGEIDLGSSDGTFVMALGFGPTAMEAGQHALISLLEDFDDTQAEYVRAWKAWHAKLKGGVPPKSRSPLYHTSAAVLRTHESKRVEGGIIASLSIPWGFSKPDDDLGGYHLVWPRDLVETAGGFIAMGAHEHVRRVLRYLQVTQEPDGHWSQNMWLDGTPYWHGIQMDETALPILLVDLAARHGRHRRELARRVVADGAASGGISRAQWSRESAGSLGGRARLFAVHHRDRDRRAAGRRRSGRRGIEQDGSRLSARDGRRLECQHRTMAVCVGNGIGASARRRWLLRARGGARSGGCRVPVSRIRADQEPASGSIGRTGGLDGQPGRARVRALRAARAG